MLTTYDRDRARDAHVRDQLAAIRAEAQRRVPEWKPWMTELVGFGGSVQDSGAAFREACVTQNRTRAIAYGKHNAALAKAALDILGGNCPAHWRQTAQARIDDPCVSWAVIAERLGCTKDVARNNFHRLIRQAGLKP